MVEVEQREGKSKPKVNNRIIATPSWHEALSTLEEGTRLAEQRSQADSAILRDFRRFHRQRGHHQGLGQLLKKTKAFVDKKRL